MANPLLTATTPGVRAAETPEAAYLRRYPGIAADKRWGKDPYGHYQRYGKAEGRIWDDAPSTAVVDPATKMLADAIPAYAPAPANFYGDDAASWDAYRSAGQASSEGMNRMPFVFSNYADTPEDPAVGNALFFGGRGDPDAAAAAGLSNPLLSSPVAQMAAAGSLAPPTPFAAPAGGAAVPMAPMPSPANPLLAAAPPQQAPEPVYYIAQSERSGNDSTPTVTYFNTQTGYSSPHAGGPLISQKQWQKMQREAGAK